MAKITVIRDSDGNIIGTANLTGDKGTPTMARMSAGTGTTVQEVDVDDSFMNLSPGELHLKLQDTRMSPVKTR
jgi:hypothetical protein